MERLDLALEPAQLLALVALAVALAWLLAPTRAQRAVGSLPRPLGSLPLLGDTLTVLARRRTMHSWIYGELLRLEGKPFAVDLVTKPPMVVLSTIEAMEDVLKTHAEKFVKGYNFTEALGDLFGEGIFVTDGAKWAHQRKTASLLFTPQMMRDIMDAVMVQQTEKLCDIVASVARKGDHVDLKHLLELFATDVFATIGFGVDLEFMTNDNHEFFERFGRANLNTLFRQQQPMAVWKLQKLLGLGVEGQHTEDVAWLDQFVYKIIQDSIARKNNPESPMQASNPSHKDIVSLFLSNSKDDFDVKEIRDMAMAFISAGRDTTAYSMSWFMIMMAQNPEVQHKIRDELWRKIPQLMTGELKAPSKDQTADLVYLEAALKENLRLNTVIPLNTRESVADVSLSDGTFLAAGTQVLLPAYGMARLKWIWGEDACEFKPERWIDLETGKLLTVSPFKFLTFSGGPRICPGKQFSIMEMKIALAALLSKFHIATVRDPHSFQYESSLALGIQGPLLVRPTFVSRSQAP